MVTLDQISPTYGENQYDSNVIDQIVQDILADMSLKKKAAIAKLDEEDAPYFQYAFDTLVGEDDEAGKSVMHRMWGMLQETHRVRCVK